MKSSNVAMMPSSNVCSTSYASQRTIHSSRRLMLPSTTFTLHQRSGQQRVMMAATGSTESVSGYAREAGKKFQQFVSENELDKKLKAASGKAGEAFQELQQNAQRTFVQLDSEYSITDKAGRAAKRVEEAAKDIDQTYSVRRKMRNTMETLQRKWPIWNRQFQEYAQTWYGKASVVVGMLLLFSSAFFWKILNVVLLLWWLSVPLSFLLIEGIRRQQAERVAAAEAAEAQRRTANPFADMFRARAGAGDARAGGFAGRSAAASRSTQAGPVIDAEWTSIDEGDKKRK